LAHHLPADAARVGVVRPIASDPGGPSDLALPAAQNALERAGLVVADVELIVFATMTPDVTFPGAACYLQDKLGCGTVGAVDIRGQCAGFLMALLIADSFLELGTYRRILLAAAEVHSAGLDYSERGARIAALYGDAAAVTLLGRGDGPGLEAVAVHTDGRRHQQFWCEYPASRQHPVRVTLDNMRASTHYPSMDFDAVAAFGREMLPAVVREVLAKAGRQSERVDCFIFSHILPDVAADAAAALQIPGDRFINAGAAHGHLTAATLPVVLSEAITARRLQSGQTVCLAACGAGFAWGAAVLTL
jgi:3-oxoacyl-[acyl-carrier-protein] synthase-3